MKRNPLFGALALVFIAILTIGCDRDQTARIDENEFKIYLKEKYFEIADDVVQPADFEYQLVSGEQENLYQNKGKVILLNFWATWCYPCKIEMPDMEELSQEMGDSNFRILAVNSGESKIKIKGFLKKFPYTFDIIVDENRNITNSFKIVGLPTTLILNHNLEIVAQIMGPINWKDKTFIENLTKFSGT